VAPLVKTLDGAEIERDLEHAFVTLARIYLAHRGGGGHDEPDLNPQRLDLLVRRTESPIDLSEARKLCAMIDAISERPIEVFNNLGHVFVLLEAIRLVRGRGLEPTWCAPTQQSTDGLGQSTPDLRGGDWALEAYGGSDISNNGKLAKDLRFLQTWRAAGKRTFIACRRDAWRIAESLSEHVVQRTSSLCSAKHGGPFRASAQVTLFARSAKVAVIEVDEIEITPTAPIASPT